MADHITKTEKHYPFVVSVGVNTWRLLDMRNGSVIEELPRDAGTEASSANHEYLLNLAAGKFAEYQAVA